MGYWKYQYWWIGGRRGNKSWKPQEYTCMSYFEMLCNDDSAAEFSPFKMIWKASITPKIQVFLWALAQGKLKSGQVIQRKFPNLCLTPWCMMCNRSAETSNHLFLHCFAASKLWYKLCREAESKMYNKFSYSSLHLIFYSGSRTRIVVG